MLFHLPAIAREIVPPPIVWRADTGRDLDEETSAADVIRHEQEERRHPLGIGARLLAELDQYPAAALLWVTFTRADALRYGDEASIFEIALDAPAYVLAKDGAGGFLLFFDDEATTRQPIGSTMTQSNDPTKRDDIDEAAALGFTIDALQQRAETITTERGGSAAGHYQAHREAFDDKQLDLAAAVDVEQFAGTPESVKAAQDAKQAHGHDYAAFLAGRLEDFHAGNSNGDGPEAAQHYGGLREKHAAAAAQLRERGDGPDYPTDPTKPEPTNPRGGPDGPSVAPGSIPEGAGGGKYAALNQTHEAIDAIGGYVLFEHHLQGGKVAETNAYLFDDRAGATETARNYPFSQEEALRKGDNAFAEVHPVSKEFAAKFEDMRAAGRLNDTEALYSTSREINGHLVGAHPNEPGAMQGQYKEAAAGEDEERKRGANGPSLGGAGGPTRPVHLNATTEIRPEPGGSGTTKSADFRTNENPDNIDGEENPVAKAIKTALREGAAEPQPMHPDEHDAALKRQEQEATERQEKFVAAGKGEEAPGKPADRPMTADEKLEASFTQAKEAATQREAEEGRNVADQSQGQSRAAAPGRGGPGF